MNFSVEREMHQVVRRRLPELLEIHNDSYAVGYEIPLTNRVADIGFAPIGNTNFASAQAIALSKLNLSELLKFSIWLSFSINTKTESDDLLLANLHNNDLVRVNRAGHAVASTWLEENIGPLIMVETKLSNWRVALDQAEFYRKVTDYSCVVLDAANIDSASSSLFEAKGVGLFSASRRKLTMLIPPRKSRVENSSLKYLFSLKMLADLGRKNSRKWELQR